jgi:lipoprotein-releasing system permease protein
MRLEWFIARRYLSSRRGARFLSLITLIAIGGVFVGVMALIVVTSVMTGLQRDLRDKILGTNPHIWVTTYGESMRIDGDQLDMVTEVTRGVPGVAAAAPFVHAEVALGAIGDHAEAAILRGIDPLADGIAITEIVEQIRRGDFNLGQTESGHPPLLVGDALAERFSAYPGRLVNVISFQGAQINAMGMLNPRVRRFEVVGRFRTGMYEYDNKFMYTTVEAAQELTGLGDAVTGLEIRVPDPMMADAVGARIVQELGFPYRAEDWKTMNSSLFSALQLEKLAMGIILLLIVVVAAFNIISTLVMVVTDKTREIGILKSMGLRPAQVQRVFMLQGIVIGVVGSFFGAVAGLTLSWMLDRYELVKIPGDVYFIDRLPVAFDPVEITIIVLASLGISFLATLYPARQAARLYPVEAIRHE